MISNTIRALIAEYKSIMDGLMIFAHQTRDPEQLIVPGNLVTGGYKH